MSVTHGRMPYQKVVGGKNINEKKLGLERGKARGLQ